MKIPIHRLDSWKSIALYLKRDVKTCMQWAKSYGLPVYRIDENSKRSRVFAFESEIDEWFVAKANKSNLFRP